MNRYSTDKNDKALKVFEDVVISFCKIAIVVSIAVYVFC